MKKTVLILFTFLLSTVTISAQYVIQGSVKEKKSGNSMELATVRLLKVKDSVLVQGSRTNQSGKFELKDLKSDIYILSISSVGYTKYEKNITLQGKNIDLDAILLDEDAKVLSQVDVNGTAVQVMVRNDTVEYNASSVKTNQNAVVEEVLKKLPGVEIDNDGKITVNGQEIKKIRVDGKKFFGDDVQMATKNLPADMIDKIQVVDQKSDMAQLTGFEDDDTERIINLTTKKEKRQGIIGNVTAGAGLDVNTAFRYDGNAFLNIMNGETRSTITAGANNINTARSARGRGGFGGGQNAGLVSTQNLGYNVNTPLSDKLIIGGNATLNHSDNVQTSETNRESFLKEQTYNTNSVSNSNRNNYDGNMRLEMEWKPDSLNTLVFQPNLGFTRNFYNGNSTYTYLTNNNTTSWGNSINGSNGIDINGGLNFIYNKKFNSKKGRALTTNLNVNFSQSNSQGATYSEKNTLDTTIVVDQENENNSIRNNFGARVSYVEPIWKSQHFLEAALSLNGSYSNSTRNLFDDKDKDGKYTDLNNEYSNEFKNKFYREALELNYRYYQQNYNMMLGVKVEPSQTFSTTIYGDNPGITLENKVVNFAPSAQFRYNFGKRQFARIDYRGRTNQPSISQMQPVKNNTDLMNETVGNPTLNPSFSHNLRLMFTTYNQKTFSSFNIGVMGDATKDQLTSNSIYDPSGKRYIQTVNSTKMPYSSNMFMMFNTPIIQKRLQFSTNTNIGFQQQYGYTSKNVAEIDVNNLALGDTIDTKRMNASENVSFTFTHDIIDIGIRTGVKYTKTRNNVNTNNVETYDWNFTPNLVLRPTEALTFSTDLNYITMRGYSNFNQDQWLWNASMDWSVMKKRGVLSLKVIDILRQQLNIRQTVGENYIQYSKYNSLQTYFLVSFSLKINKFAGKSNPAQEMNQERRFMGPRDGDEPTREIRRSNSGGEITPPPPGDM